MIESKFTKDGEFILKSKEPFKNHKVCKLCSDTNRFETWVEKTQFTKDLSNKDGLRSSCKKHYTRKEKASKDARVTTQNRNDSRPYDLTWAHETCNNFLKMRFVCQQ